MATTWAAQALKRWLYLKSAYGARSASALQQTPNEPATLGKYLANFLQIQSKDKVSLHCVKCQVGTDKIYMQEWHYQHIPKVSATPTEILRHPAILSATGPQEPNDVLNQRKARLYVEKMLGLLKESNLNEIRRLMSEEVMKNPKLNSAALYNFALLALLSGSGHETANELGEALRIFNVMLRNHLMPSAASLDALILALCRTAARSSDRPIIPAKTFLSPPSAGQAYLIAVSLWISLDHRTLVVSNTALAALLKAAVARGTREVADELWEAVVARTVAYAPRDLLVLGKAYMRILSRTASVNALLALESALPGLNLTAQDAAEFRRHLDRSRIQALVVAGQVEEAQALVDEMTDDSLHQLHSLEMFVLSLAETSQLTSVKSALSQLTSHPAVTQKSLYPAYFAKRLIKAKAAPSFLVDYYTIVSASGLPYDRTFVESILENFLTVQIDQPPSAFDLPAEVLDRLFIDMDKSQVLEANLLQPISGLNLPLALRLVAASLSADHLSMALRVARHIEKASGALDPDQINSLILQIVRTPNLTIDLLHLLCETLRSAEVQPSETLSQAVLNYTDAHSEHVEHLTSGQRECLAHVLKQEIPSLRAPKSILSDGRSSEFWARSIA